MNTKPDIKVGDTVRVMQTDTMTIFGHANKVFRVSGIRAPDGCGRVLIGRELGTGVLMLIPENSVMIADDTAIKHHERSLTT